MIGSLVGVLFARSRWACGKKKLAEKEWPAEKNEGDTDLSSV